MLTPTEKWCFHPSKLAGPSMPEVPDAGEDHGYAQLVGGGDYFLIFHRASGLDDGCGSGLGYGLKAVWEREKGVRCGYATLEREEGFHGAEACGVYAAHLAGAYAEGLAGAGIDNGVRFYALADAPGEEQAAQFLGGGRTPGDDFQLRFGNAGGIGVLQEHAARNLLDHRPRRGGVDFNQAQVLFGGEALAGFRREGRGYDGLDKELGDLGRGIGVHGAVDADDAAEG